MICMMFDVKLFLMFTPPIHFTYSFELFYILKIILPLVRPYLY